MRTLTDEKVVRVGMSRTKVDLMMKGMVDEAKAMRCRQEPTLTWSGLHSWASFTMTTSGVSQGVRLILGNVRKMSFSRARAGLTFFPWECRPGRRCTIVIRPRAKHGNMSNQRPLSRLFLSLIISFNHLFPTILLPITHHLIPLPHRYSALLVDPTYTHFSPSSAPLHRQFCQP